MNESYLERINQLRSTFQKNDIEGLLISNFYTILYVTGFKTLSPDEREAFAFISKDKLYVFTDGRYVDQKLQTILDNLGADLKLIEIGKGLLYHLSSIGDYLKLKKIGFEAEDITYLEYENIKNSLSTIHLQPLTNVAAAMREIKSPSEIASLRKACELTDRCLKKIKKKIKVGIKEKEAAWWIESWIRQNEYELGFDPIVAVDENAAVAHYDTKTGNGVVKEHSVILIDFGIKYENYISDITRMFFMGNQPAEVKKTYEALLKAQTEALSSIQSGIELQQIDAKCREILQKEGLPNYSHSTGHGVGLEVHEGPRVSVNSVGAVQPHQIFTVEPGIYIPGKYGMRIEDTVLIDDQGNAVQLTQFRKSFTQLS